MIYQYNRALRNLTTLYIKGLNVKPNTTYRFSADVLGDSFSLYVSNRGICGGNVIHNTPETKTWTNVSFEFSTSAEESLTEFGEWGISLLRLPGKDSRKEPYDAYMDNVRLHAINDPTDNLIEGGSFEERKPGSYVKNWAPEVLGLSGKIYGISIVIDPTNPENHCLKLPKELISRTYPSSFPLKVAQFRRCSKNEKDMHNLIPNTNDEFLLLFAKKGTICCRMNGTEMNATEGTLIIAPPQTEVEYTFCHGSNTDYYYLSFCGEESEYLMGKIGLNKPCTVSLPDVTKFSDFVTEMLHIPTSSHTYYHHLSGLLQLFLSELERQRESMLSVSQYQRHIEKIVEQMQEQPENAISNDVLAADCGISKSHFINLFKQHTGYAPQKYRLKELVKKACLLLETSTMTVQQISYTLGVDDPLYFSRLFRSVQGLSPREYRKQRQNAPVISD